MGFKPTAIAAAHCDLPCGVYDPAQAKIEAQSVKACMEKYADLPVDQMFSMLYKGISQRDSNEIDISIASFTKGLETAKLGNSKYMQMEQKFLKDINISLNFYL